MTLLHGNAHADGLIISRTQIAVGDGARQGELCCVHDALGVVVFAHANGFKRSSHSNRELARRLRLQRLDTLEFELLAPGEPDHDAHAADIALLADRLLQAIDALPSPQSGMPLGLFGSGHASAAALLAETRLGPRVSAVVSRGGRPDLVTRILGEVQAPTLLMVGAADAPVLELNRQACAALRCVKRIELVPRASHLFQEAGALDAVATAAADWFCSHLQPASAAR
jgi:pimeloyl-ACP methyl ester carboxylesterase